MGSTLQTSENPFGDYSRQSPQVQGILKNMHEEFLAALENANVQEANDFESFKDLEGTKIQELGRLTTSEKTQNELLLKIQADLAENEKKLHEKQSLLKDHEKYFTETTEQCKETARDWSE